MLTEAYSKVKNGVEAILNYSISDMDSEEYQFSVYLLSIALLCYNKTTGGITRLSAAGLLLVIAADEGE